MLLRSALFAALLLVPVASGAQPVPANPSLGPPLGPPASVFDGSYVTVGLGVGAVPRYEGSADYRLFPAPLLQGSVDGFDFAARGPGLAVDLVRDAPRARVNIIAGPLVRGRFDRRGGFGDARVAALGKLPVAVEVGGQFGVRLRDVAGRGTALGASVDISRDIAGGHGGTLISPSLSWTQPVGSAVLLIASAGATHASGGYMATYFGVDAAGAAASGFAPFAARPGWKDVGAGAVLAYDLNGNARDGGWSLFAITRATRLTGSAARSPVTAVAGDATQIFAASGIAYTF